MNARRLAFAAITLLASPWSDAQNAVPTPQQDPVLEVIRKFNRPEARDPNKDTAVPAAPEGSPAPIQQETTPRTTPEPPATTQPPDATEPVPDTPNPDPASPPTIPAPPAPTPRRGLVVHVENLQPGTGVLDPSQVKLLTPFPAKPLAPAPAGWCLKPLTNAPPFTREVELAPGKTITLTIRPQILVPDVDGTSAFSVPEPGFDPALGYRQNATADAILAHSIQQLENDSRALGAVIDKLQQILVSLPKPEPEPKPEPQTAPKPSPTHKR